MAASSYRDPPEDLAEISPRTFPEITRNTLSRASPRPRVPARGTDTRSTRSTRQNLGGTFRARAVDRLSEKLPSVAISCACNASRRCTHRREAPSRSSSREERGRGGCAHDTRGNNAMHCRGTSRMYCAITPTRTHARARAPSFSVFGSHVTGGGLADRDEIAILVEQTRKYLRHPGVRRTRFARARARTRASERTDERRGSRRRIIKARA